MPRVLDEVSRRSGPALARPQCLVAALRRIGQVGALDQVVVVDVRPVVPLRVGPVHPDVRGVRIAEDLDQLVDHAPGPAPACPPRSPAARPGRPAARSSPGWHTRTSSACCQARRSSCRTPARSASAPRVPGVVFVSAGSRSNSTASPASPSGFTPSSARSSCTWMAPSWSAMAAISSTVVRSIFRTSV